MNKPTITIMGKIYRQAGQRSCVWSMINPDLSRFFNTRGKLVFQWPARIEEEKGEWMEVGNYES